jgi:hypothetical protein
MFDKLQEFLLNDSCPNFVKADIERAKLGDNNVNCFDEENVDDGDGEQPEARKLPPQITDTLRCLQMKLCHDDISSSERDNYLSKGMLFVTVKPLFLVQHSQYHTQAWRANGDISLILSKNGPENPSVDEIIAVEKYITGYACKGNEPTGAIADLFNDMVNC